MTLAQRFRFFTLMLALGSTAATAVSVTPSSSTPVWGVLIISGTLAIFAAAFSSADRNVQFFGKNQQGLRELRSTGNVIPARVLTVATEAQGENGHVFIRLRLDVAPPAGPLFRTSTSTRITATDVPRFQPGQMLPVRHLPKFPGTVTIEPAPTTGQLQDLGRAVWSDAGDPAEFSGRLPAMRPGMPRTLLTTLATVVVLASGAALAAAIIQATS